MKLNKDTPILIVGLGLMGGSYARALTARGYRVSALARQQKDIDYALKEGIIEAGSAFVDEALLQQAQLVIFALYPQAFKDWIAAHQQLLRPGALLTDVTGVKSCLVYDIQEMLRPDVEFISAHPMAGRELSGVENSDAGIFRGANYIVTPTEKNSPQAVELCMQLGQLLGFARVSCLSPEEHDRVIGFVSQLTHCIAVALMTCRDTEQLGLYTGDSFRDLTRIARINEQMWSELFLSNRPALLEQMDLFAQEFDRLRQLLAQGDREGLQETMRLSTARRIQLDQGR